MTLIPQPPSEADSLIYPPPEIKTACDKTAIFVAKNGPGFEERIREKELYNPKFCFLNPHDPYHKYYLFKIKEIKEAAIKPKPSTSGSGGVEVDKNGAAAAPPPPPLIPNATMEHVIPFPPPPHQFLMEIPTLSKQDLEIIKLTAQFTARSGHSFLTAISSREAKNTQFDFVRPSHPLYPYFRNLVERYTRILVPGRGLMEGLQESATDRYQVLASIMKKVEYDAYTLAEKEKAQQAADAEKIAFATIDWHDFTVVETIEFLEADNKAVLPPPVTILELQSMTLEERRGLLKFGDSGGGGVDDMEMDMDGNEEEMDMEGSSDEEENNVEGKTQHDAVAPKFVAKPVVVGTSANAPASGRTTFVPKVGRHAKSEPTQVCTICNLVVKLSEMAEHVRVELLDPRYAERRAALQAKERDSNLVVAGDVVATNLAKMTAFRTDIFGNGTGSDVSLQQKIEWETAKGKEAGKNKVIWDGHQGSVPLVQAKMASISTRNIKPPPPPVPTSGPVKPPPPSKQQHVPLEVKRIKTNANALSLTISLPADGAAPLVFNDLTPLWTVSQLKERLAPLTGMAVGKQKLVLNGGAVLKNAFSLHESGVKNGDTIELTLKKK